MSLGRKGMGLVPALGHGSIQVTIFLFNGYLIGPWTIGSGGAVRVHLHMNDTHGWWNETYNFLLVA